MDLITTKTITRIFWIAINLSCLIIAQDIQITVPAAVKRGDNATLICDYYLKYDNLYTIKWYKGNREFYRYTPKEDIPIKVFWLFKISVEKSMSNATHVMLTSLEPGASGKYTCEVTTDAPLFQIFHNSSELEVVDLPKLPPRIDIDDKIYSIGNMLLANCTVDNSKPLANLTWLLNNNTLRAHEIIRYNIIGDSTLNSTTSVVGLKLVLQSKHFRHKNLRLECKAAIYDIYENITEKILELNTTSNQIYTDDFITIGSSRHTQYDGDFNGYGDPSDIRMHHMHASPDRSSSASSCSKCCSSLLLFSLTATILYFYNTKSNTIISDVSNSHNSSSNTIITTISSRHKRIINNNNNNTDVIIGNSSCYNFYIISSSNNDDSIIQNIIILAILLRVSSFSSSSLSVLLSSLSSLSSILFLLINWSNVYSKTGLININVGENIMKKNYENIQVLLSKSTLLLSSSVSS